MEALHNDSPKVFTLQSKEINSNWHWIEPFLERVRDAPWNVLDVRLALVRKEAQLWVLASDVPLGIVITRLGKCGDTQTGLVWIAAGEQLADGLDMYHEHIEPWFIEKGCDLVEIIGRKGWKAAFPDFEEKAVVLVKRFTDEQKFRHTDQHYH